VTPGARPALFDEAQALAARCADPGVLPQRLNAARRAAVTGPEELSERELTVLRHLASNLSEREIAAELYLSFNTVHSHVKSIYRKLGVSSRAEAVERSPR
jgi:LuxR family maltose regulon positive regulatory protein